MNQSITILISFLAIATAFYLVNQDKENFEAVGLIYNRPPEWFNKAAYNPKDWLVSYYPQQLGHPECMYRPRGNPEELNYLSSAYRFWRM